MSASMSEKPTRDRKKKGANRVKEFLFTKRSYVGVGYPPATDARSGYFKGAKVVNALGGAVTLCLIPSEESLDGILIYLTAADAYELGKLLMERAEVASPEVLKLELERR